MDLMQISLMDMIRIVAPLFIAGTFFKLFLHMIFESLEDSKQREELNNYASLLIEQADAEERSKELWSQVREAEQILSAIQLEKEIADRQQRGFTLTWVLPKKQKTPRRTSEGFVYVIKDIDVTGYYKIGKASDTKTRLGLFEVKLPFQIQKICLIFSDDYSKLETTLHKRFKSKRKNGEWFELSDDDIAYLTQLAEESQKQ